MTQQATKEFDALDKELETLINQLRPFSHAQLNQLADNGGWSAMQCVHHIMLAERGSLQYVQKKLSFNPELNDCSPLKDWSRKFLFRNVMNIPVKIKAPKNLSGEFLPANSDLEATMDEWLALRKDLRHFLSDLDKDYFRKELMKHPLVGKITLTAMLVFFRAHLRRHQRQALRVLNN